MTSSQLREGRKKRGWTQEKAAAKLGVSQPYLALMESGRRRITENLALKAAALYRLSLAALPLQPPVTSAAGKCEANKLAGDLAGLGYPGFAYVRPSRKKNPAEVLSMAVNCDDLDSRLIEALPWILLHYPDLEWNWLVTVVKIRNRQNRLGFIVSLTRRLAEMRGSEDLRALLAHHEAVLDQARLMREDTLCHDWLSQAERRWIRKNRSEQARYWNLLTDLRPEHLSYAS